MANPTDHYKLSGLDVHGTIWQEAADATERLALSLVALDQGKDVLQLDTGHVYKLIVDTGVNEAASWVDIAASGTGSEVNNLTAAVTWANIPDGNVPESAVTQHEGAIDHDALTNFDGDKHIDWSVTGVEDIHADRYTAGGGTDTFTYHEGGTYQAAQSTSTWVGPPNGSVWDTAVKVTSYGTGTSPAAQPYQVGYCVPVDCSVKRIETWYRPNNTAVEGELAVYRHRWTSGSATVSTVLVGSCAVASGGVATYAYDASIDVNVSLLQGDRLQVYYRAAGTPAGGYTCYYTTTVMMER